ncbi:MAG: RNA polymerase sigma factor [Planctomycetota bacterium]|nr:RNA polymerase sigma factor [Planctomycetota bacterium]
MNGQGTAISAREMRLLAAARGGDRTAFADLVRDAAPALERLALRLLGHRQDAEDVAQDAVFAAWRQLDGFRGRARFKTWICRILVHRSLDVLRRRKPTTTLEAVPSATADPGPAAAASDRELEALVRAEVERLPPVQRATLLLRADQGLSYDEIAYVLGSTRNAVRMNLVAARKKLAQRLAGVVDLGEGSA